MDYKYIEQLIERYFQCETSLKEEQILRAFFAQSEDNVPSQLRQYMPLFAAMCDDSALDDSFDKRVLAMTSEVPVVKARTISMSQRLQPLFRAAAVVAIVLTLGNAMNLSLRQGTANSDDINYAAYKDTYDDPNMAYDQVEGALQLISEGFSQAMLSDSLRSDSLISELR